MEEERYQKELFEFKPPRRTFPGFRKLHIRGDLALTLNLEKMIFAAIGVLMLLVVVYAVGVEKGKTMQGAAAAGGRALQGQPVPAEPPRSAQKVVAMATIPETRLAGMTTAGSAKFTQSAPKPAMPAVVKMDAPRDTAGLYTVLAVTFRRQDAARAEVARLKGEGFDAFVRPSDVYFQVCVGAYPTRDSAEKASVRVRRLYRDAYVIMK
jgi:cell division septation protein DedD